MSDPYRRWLPFAAALVIAAVCYIPGLRGPFLFDDYANLPSLQLMGHPGSRAGALANYLTSGRADPTGRPVALLSFLLDARDWPSDPLPFKRTNLVLHLLNGVLLACLLRRLGRRLGRDPVAVDRAAMFGAACWLVHPLFASTTLYVVQREAMLSTGFIFAGLIAFDAARRTTRERYRFVFWALYGACLILGSLSKANGILLPLLALIVDIWLPVTPDRPKSLAMRGLVLAPTIVLLASVCIVALRVIGAGVLPHRGWSVTQRLMTEPRILFDYLGALWIPRPGAPGLFNDDVVVSTSLWHPWTTLPALGGVIVSAIVAWRARARAPVATAAIAFFLAGHLIESTVVPLELYFEHRNYLAAALLFWPLGFALVAPLPAASPSVNYIRAFALFAIPAALTGALAVRAGLWGDPASQALLWAQRKPDSPRAQSYAASIEMQRGRPDSAANRLRAALATHPDQAQLALPLLDAECVSGGSTLASRNAALAALGRSRTVGPMEFNWLASRIDALPAQCPGLDAAYFARAVGAIERNPIARNVPGRRQDAAHLRGLLALRTGRADSAVWFARALQQDPQPATALEEAALLARAGRLCEAQQFLESNVEPVVSQQPPLRPSMPAIHRWWLWKSGYWANEARHLRGQLTHDLTTDDCARRS